MPRLEFTKPFNCIVPRRTSRTRAIRIALISFGITLTWLADSQAEGQRMPEDPVVAQVESSIRDRLVNIAQFKVTEDYRVYRNGSDKPAAQKVFRAEYEKNSGMRYTDLGGGGSTMLQSRAIEPPRTSDREGNDPKMRDQVALTSDNYDFQREPGNVSLNGRDCLIFDITARRKSIYLLNGKAWVDAKTLSLVRIKGVQSLKLSFWAGLPEITRDYEDVNGFPMVVYEEIEAHSYLFGQTTVKIKYQDYSVVRGSK